jgi:hypothetical protein
MKGAGCKVTNIFSYISYTYMLQKTISPKKMTFLDGLKQEGAQQPTESRCVSVTSFVLLDSSSGSGYIQQNCTSILVVRLLLLSTLG